MEQSILLRADKITKHFGITKALDAVSMDIYAGEVLGLIGENGSGKSTIASIIAGSQKKDNGSITFCGYSFTANGMADALNKGVGMIIQETGTVPGITVAENIFLGETKNFRHHGIVNRTEMNNAAKKILSKCGIKKIEPDMVVGALDFQNRKLIEIARVMVKQPRLIIVDETTTALSQEGRTILYSIIKAMRTKGNSVLFISHDLSELMEYCDRMTVLRDGHLIRTLTRAEFNEQEIKQLMVGREMTGDYYRSDFDAPILKDVVLDVCNLSLEGKFTNVNFKVHSGEIVGIGGLSQCGMHELGRSLFGLEPFRHGKVMVHGYVVENEQQALRCKMGYMSKNRDIEALNLTASISDNIAIVAYNKIAVLKKIIFKSKEHNYVQELSDRLHIKCVNVEQKVSDLSGGNKQKVVFAKWIGCGSEVIILDCPTRGVDIGVKQSMYQLMADLKKQGKALILISEELTELIGMSDRLLIMKDGIVQKEFARSKSLTESSVINYMI